MDFNEDSFPLVSVRPVKTSKQKEKKKEGGEDLDHTPLPTRPNDRAGPAPLWLRQDPAWRRDSVTAGFKCPPPRPSPSPCKLTLVQPNFCLPASRWEVQVSLVLAHTRILSASGLSEKITLPAKG